MANSNIISIFRLLFHESFMASLGCRSAGDKAMKCLPWIIEDFPWPSCREFFMQTSSNIHDDISKRESERESCPGSGNAKKQKPFSISRNVKFMTIMNFVIKCYFRKCLSSSPQNYLESFCGKFINIKQFGEAKISIFDGICVS